MSLGKSGSRLLVEKAVCGIGVFLEIASLGLEHSSGPPSSPSGAAGVCLLLLLFWLLLFWLLDLPYRWKQTDGEVP